MKEEPLIKSKLRILYLEDNPDDVELVRSLLVRDGISCDLVQVETRADFVDALEQGGFDVIFLDYLLPSFDGLSALKIVREKAPDTPVIIVSGSIPDDVAIELLNEGATDYVLKDKLSRLAFSIRRAVREAEERTQRKKAEEMLIKASEHWRETFDSMPYGVMLLDREFNIIKTNDYISKLTGVPIKELIDKKCCELIHGTDKPIECCPLLKSSKISGAETYEYYEAKFNKYFKGCLTPIFDKEGLPQRYIISLVDITENKENEKTIVESRDAFLNMLKDLDFSYKELKEIYQGLIISFVSALDAKSPWTKGHSMRVTDYAIEIAKEIGLSEQDIEILNTAALLHDIGKIGTYDTVLDKPGRLNDEEFALVKLHPGRGAEILSPIRQFKPILPIIRHHHESMDGKGYPDGLKGDGIPFLARILHVADSFDAMTADRPYRPAPGKEYAISEFKKYNGIQFDPDVVEAFLKVLKKQA
jgi:putative nucleotidyltransferase with HDIG domain/PAS domain S-box-containing protein